MYIVGIAGGSGSGKTTFAKKVLKQTDNNSVRILHMDSYYLPTQPEENYTDKGRPNFDHPDAFDWSLIRQHIKQLKNGQPIDVPIYDYKKSRRTLEVETLVPSKVILFEGIFTLFDKIIRNIIDVQVFLDVDADIRFIRRLHRDVKERARSLESVTEQYYDTVRPMYEKFLAPQSKYADFIVGEETDVAASILAAKINTVIHQGADEKPLKTKSQNPLMDESILSNELSC